MPKHSALLTSTKIVTADSSKGRRYGEICRAQYNKAQLDVEEAQRLNEHPEFAAYLVAGIRKFSTKGPVFTIYLEIEVGGKTKETLLAELQSADSFVSDWAKDIMSKPAFKSGKEGTVKFGRATISELGFSDPKNLPTTRQVWTRIVELGHSLCQSCDGPAIRKALKDQPKGDYFWTAMEQIADSDGDPSVFYFKRDDDGERWLDAWWVNPDGKWLLGSTVVFRLRK